MARATAAGTGARGDTLGTVILWDIDGTLVSGRGAGRRGLELAFERLHGRPDAFSAVRFDGCTDRAIVRSALRAIAVADDDAAVDAALSAYVTALAGLSELLGAYRPQAGVLEALSALQGREVLASGLGTGNIEQGARMKLRAADLDDHFAFGGFGCDAEARAELLEVGARRGAARLGLPRDRCRVVVVGDTELDVSAAHAIGASAFAVATGGTSIEALRQASPACVFDSLTAPGAIGALLALL